jgi:serine/threonine protein phosphatase PrpC
MGCAKSKPDAAYDVQEEQKRRRLSVGNTADIPVPDKEQMPGKNAGVKLETISDVLEMFPAERKWSLQGDNVAPTADPTVMKDYSDKREVAQGKISRGIGHCCKKGMKPESPNQDDFVMLQCGKAFGLYGVFDGHGPCGHDVSNYITKMLPGNVVRDGKFQTEPLVAIEQAFVTTHRGIQKMYGNKVFDASMSGATASLAILQTDPEGKKFIHVGHVGDSRSILGVGKTWGSMKAVEIMRDHKANLPEEKKRIESSGGVVKRRQGDVPHRVFMKGSLLPGLAMSRSLGDLIAQKVGVSHVPDVKTIGPLTDQHQVLIMASDGVWEFLSNEKVLEEVQKFPPEQIQDACDAIAALSWKMWISNEFDVVDDITVIGVVLPTVLE